MRVLLKEMATSYDLQGAVMSRRVSLEEAAKLLAKGAVGVIPTDTVYGIVASAQDPLAVARLFIVKHREHKPGTIIGASVQQFVDLGLRERYIKPIAAHWPAPFSVVIPCTYGTLDYLHLGKGSLAVRIPADDLLCEALEISGPLMTSSANTPGKPTATTIEEAEAYFGDTVDFYVDGGPITDHKPSTIIAVIDDDIVTLRKGEYDFNSKQQ